MSLEQTQQIINRYFHVMSGGSDLAECYTADVTWITTDTGEELRGASSVHDYGCCPTQHVRRPNAAR